MSRATEKHAKLLRIATTVRRALENPAILCDFFPCGMCQAASKLLAKYLVEVEGISPVEGIANGVRYIIVPDQEEPHEQTHFWLEHAGFVIDITADQFDDCSDPVIVTKKSRWHDQFQEQTRLSQDVTLDLNDFLLEKYSRMMRHLHPGEPTP